MRILKNDSIRKGSKCPSLIYPSLRTRPRNLYPSVSLPPDKGERLTKIKEMIILMYILKTVGDPFCLL
jgi:hypothetical protein